MTMTIVKVQRPIFTSTGGYNCGNGPWLIYDQLNARTCTLDRVPRDVLKVFNSAPPNSTHYFKQYFDGAEWDQREQWWDLASCTPITRRLTW